MEYISTRGHGPVTFTDTLLEGLAPDGGLYLPAVYPAFTPDVLHAMADMDYAEIATTVMAPFVAPDMGQDDLAQMVREAYQNFGHPEVTPLKPFGRDQWLLELYHGPTLAFKDVAMQLLGRMLDWALAKSNRKAVVLGATSGDTGPAAIEGLKGREHVEIFMLFPHNRVSEVQRRQMTTIHATNVHPIAIEGTFDDCQHLVKTLFADKTLRTQLPLTAVNSISWARLLPQMVYYFYAWSRLHGQVHGPISFSVPTGNFGDIFAGYVAKQCGLPVHRLILANNMNDILTRFVTLGDYSTRPVVATQSPSIDILVASNFERLLYDVLGRNPAKLCSLLETFRSSGTMPALTAAEMITIRHTFAAQKVDETETATIIRHVYEEQNMLIDPHTAVGVGAAMHFPELRPTVILATAHAAKFGCAVEKATGVSPALPAHVADMMKKDEHFTLLANHATDLKAFILEKTA